MSLTLKKGEIIIPPNGTDLTVFQDTDGSIKSVDADGTKSSIGGGGAITTDATLTGAGTVPSPLGVNPVAQLAPDWYGYMNTLFQQKTGASPIGISEKWRLHAAWFNLPIGATGNGAISGGAGTQAPTPVAYSATIGGGVIVLTGGSLGNTFADIDSGGPSSFRTQLTNVKTKRWMVASQIGFGKAPAAGSFYSMGLSLSGVAPFFIGIGYAGAQTVFNYVNASSGGFQAITNVLSTDKTVPVDNTGATFLTQYVANFDLTNVVVNPDVAGGHADVNGGLVSALSSATASAYLYNEGTNSDIFFVRKMILLSED